MLAGCCMAAVTWSVAEMRSGHFSRHVCLCLVQSSALTSACSIVFPTGLSAGLHISVGRALTMGAPRAMTAPGWAPFPISGERKAEHRARIRGQFGIPDNAFVVGIAGAIVWSPRPKYCYGLELIRAFHKD